MTTQEANEIALEVYPYLGFTNGRGYEVDTNSGKRAAYAVGLLAGFEAGVRKSAEVARLHQKVTHAVNQPFSEGDTHSGLQEYVHDFYDDEEEFEIIVSVDTDSILQLIRKEG